MEKQPTLGRVALGSGPGAVSAAEPASPLAVLENRLIQLHARLVEIGDNLVTHLNDVHGMSQNEPERDPPAPPSHARLPRLHDLVSAIENRVADVEERLQPVLKL